jgi:hypothetical protein
MSIASEGWSEFANLLVVKLETPQGSGYAICQILVAVDEDPAIVEAIEARISYDRSRGVMGEIGTILVEDSREWLMLASKVQVKPGPVPGGFDMFLRRL